MGKKEEKPSQWSELPEDMLRAIQQHLIPYCDKVTLSSVCSNWLSALRGTLPNLNSGLPWLLLPYNKDNATIQTCYGLYNLKEKKTYFLELPETQGKLFRGSSHGWLFTVENSPSISMLNPLTRVQVQLPPRYKFPDIHGYHPKKIKIGQEYTIWDHTRRQLDYPCPTMVQRNWIEKIVLSSNPSSTTNDYVAVAIFGEFSRLAYCKKGDKKWFHVDRGIYLDVIFHEGRFYALSCEGELTVCEFGSQLRVTERIKPVGARIRNPYLYLVRAPSFFFMVERSQRRHEENRVPVYKAVDFHVYKLKVEPTGARWSRMNDIGGLALFVGHNHSFAIPSCHLHGLKRNSIYFTDNCRIFHDEGVQGGSDIGVFNLETRRVEPFPGYECNSILVWPPPIWIIPSTQ